MEGNTILTQRWRLSLPRVLLHIEGAVLFILAAVVYFNLGYAWWLYLLLLLFPDLSMIGYLAGPSAGSLIYDLVHTTTIPLILGAVAWWLAWPVVLPVSLIWLSHIGMDRMVGYGLKYPEGFKSTHFERV
jgi:hypothetical protein